MLGLSVTWRRPVSGWSRTGHVTTVQKHTCTHTVTQDTARMSSALLAGSARQPTGSHVPDHDPAGHLPQGPRSPLCCFSAASLLCAVAVLYLHGQKGSRDWLHGEAGRAWRGRGEAAPLARSVGRSRKAQATEGVAEELLMTTAVELRRKKQGMRAQGSRTAHRNRSQVENQASRRTPCASAPTQALHQHPGIHSKHPTRMQPVGRGPLTPTGCARS